MRKPSGIILFLLLITLTVACPDNDDPVPDLPDEITPPVTEVKYVALGDSLTAGVQSAGIVSDFQFNSFPYLISLQLGIDNFEQPLVSQPGIGFEAGKTPLFFENGEIKVNDLNVSPVSLLINFNLPRPYDNLGIPGAQLADLESASQLLFELVLRGMGSQLDQAISLEPDIITVWIGSNDILAAVTTGGDLSRITPAQQFNTDLGIIFQELAQKTDAVIITANLADVTAIPFVNALDGTFRTIPEIGITTPVPVLVDQNLQPIQFPGGFFVPLVTEESDVEHLLLSFLPDYLEHGVGIPDKQMMMDAGLSEAEADQLVAAIQSFGLIPSGIPVGAGFTLNSVEKSAIQSSVISFNNSISSIAGQFGIPVVDFNSALIQLNSTGINGFSGNFVLTDTPNTAFSLDGIHPNNAGYAIVANLFIEKINEETGLDIPPLNTGDFSGQYSQ